MLRKSQGNRETFWDMAGFARKTAMVLLAALAPGAPAFAGDSYFVYFVSASDGIFVSRFDTLTGEISTPKPAAEHETGLNFAELHPGRDYLYACGRAQAGGGKAGGRVHAYAIDAKSGMLDELNVVEIPKGPAHVTIDATGRLLVTASHGGASYTSLRVRKDGSLGEVLSHVAVQGSSVHPKRQTVARPHSANFSPDNRFVLIADLGQDKVLVARVDHATGKLTENDPPFVKVAPGSGPRHLAFHPSGRYVYLINELLSTVAVFSYNPDKGSLREVQTISTLPEGYSQASTTAEVLVHPSGKFLYGSNRGHDSIAVFAIDQANGKLAPVERVSTQGKTPRNFRLDPTGRFLFVANQNSNTVVLFRIDQKTGRLTPAGRSLEVPKPLCVRFVARD